MGKKLKKKKKENMTWQRVRVSINTYWSTNEMQNTRIVVNVWIWSHFFKWWWSCSVFQWRLELVRETCETRLRHVRTRARRDLSASSAAATSPTPKPSAATKTPTSASATSPNNSASTPITTAANKTNTHVFSPPPSRPPPRRRSPTKCTEITALISTSLWHPPPGSSVKAAALI